jgi:hypothetical protein
MLNKLSAFSVQPSAKIDRVKTAFLVYRSSGKMGIEFCRFTGLREQGKRKKGYKTPFYSPFFKGEYMVG